MMTGLYRKSVWQEAGAASKYPRRVGGGCCLFADALSMTRDLGEVKIFGADATEAVTTRSVHQPSCSVDPVAILFRYGHDYLFPLITGRHITGYLFTVTQIHHLTHFK